MSIPLPQWTDDETLNKVYSPFDGSCLQNKVMVIRSKEDEKVLHFMIRNVHRSCTEQKKKSWKARAWIRE